MYNKLYMVKTMKNIIALLLVGTMALTSFSCANTTNTSQTYNNKTQETSNINQTSTNSNEATTKTNETEKANTNEDELISKIKKVCQKEVVQVALKGKTISQAVGEEIKNMSEEAKKEVENYPELSLDASNFENDEKTYLWLSKALKIIIKDAIENERLTQEQVDEYKLYLTLMGIKLPEAQIKKGMSDADIEKLCLALADVADKITEPAILKLMGVDINDPDTLSNLRDLFNLN